MSLPAHAYPGLTLGLSSKYSAGPGTHVHNAHIIASLSGRPIIHESTPAASSSSSGASPTLPQISISRYSVAAASSSAASPAPPLSRSVIALSTLPSLSSEVIGTVTRLHKDRIAIIIQIVDGHAIPASDPPLTGIIRREDVRGYELDKVIPAQLFRVGDIVRARVLSLGGGGDGGAYYLTTAKNELGVLMARPTNEDDRAPANSSVPVATENGVTDGAWMVPVSWKEFVDPRNGHREERKVAKPV